MGVVWLPLCQTPDDYIEGIKLCAVLVRAAGGNGANSNESGGSYDYDLFAIGAGSGGVRAARFASNYGEAAAD